MSDFALYKQKPITFPEYAFESDNYYDKNWDGERRVKNTIISMEWVPDTNLPREQRKRSSAALTQEQAANIKRAVDLLEKAPGAGLGVS